LNEADDPGHHARARDILDEIAPDLKKFLGEHTKHLTAVLLRQLEAAGGANPRSGR